MRELLELSSKNIGVDNKTNKEYRIKFFNAMKQNSNKEEKLEILRVCMMVIFNNMVGQYN